MAGSVWLGCGSALDEQPLWRAMLGRPLTRILYWPFALTSTMLASADGWLRGNLDSLGLDYELRTWTDLDQHVPSELSTQSTDLLFVGGGNTFTLLDHVRRHGFIDAVRDFWSSGGDYYGGSAGAVLACESIAIADGHDANETRLTDLAGLALLADVAVLPHFTDDQTTAAMQWSTTHSVAVLGLPETAGLHYREGTATVIGGDRVTRISQGTVDHVVAGGSFPLPAAEGASPSASRGAVP